MTTTQKIWYEITNNWDNRMLSRFGEWRTDGESCQHTTQDDAMDCISSAIASGDIHNQHIINNNLRDPRHNRRNPRHCRLSIQKATGYDIQTDSMLMSCIRNRCVVAQNIEVQ